MQVTGVEGVGPYAAGTLINIITGSQAAPCY